MFVHGMYENVCMFKRLCVCLRETKRDNVQESERKRDRHGRNRDRERCTTMYIKRTGRHKRHWNTQTHTQTLSRSLSLTHSLSHTHTNTICVHTGHSDLFEVDIVNLFLEAVTDEDVVETHTLGHCEDVSCLSVNVFLSLSLSPSLSFSLPYLSPFL